MPQRLPRARSAPHRVLARVSALVMLTGLAAGVTADAASARTSKTATLTGVTITFGDQLKEFQTIFAATGALRGARYTVNWANFIGGPPVIAAETSGSVDLGDMAETPTIFAQSAGDPVKVVAATEGVNPRVSPYAILVPANSPIRTVAQLRGRSIAVQEGTVEQYFLVQVLARAGIPYHAVNVDNLTLTSASTAVTSGQVDAAVVVQPLTGLDMATGKVRQLVGGAGYLQTLGYLTASNAALANPGKAAALTDLIERFYRAEAVLRKNPGLAAATYVKTYGVTLAVAKEAVVSAQSRGTPITPAIVSYQQNEANTFQKLGLITSHLDVRGIFDLPFNRAVAQAAGLQP